MGTQNFYETEEEALSLTIELIQSGNWKKPFQGTNLVAHYDWDNQTGIYDSCLDQLVQLRKSSFQDSPDSITKAPNRCFTM